jgi:hypothetical protein
MYLEMWEKVSVESEEGEPVSSSINSRRRSVA